jgi:arginine-tRNA-protein transferase
MDSWKELNAEGVRMYESGDFARAYELFGDAYRMSPRIAALAYNLGMAALCVNRHDEARACIDAYQRLIERTCPYFTEMDRLGVESLPLDGLDRRAFDGLLERGFRRTGDTVSRNVCPECRHCVQTRIVLSDFEPSRSQRRVLARNADVAVRDALRPEPAPAKAELLGRYLVARHEWMDRDFSRELEEVFRPWEGSLEFDFFLGDSLIMAAIVDAGERDLYTSACFFDPDMRRRSLGTFNLLTAILWGKEKGFRYLYTGEYITSRQNMAYKQFFRPRQDLGADGRWEAGT